jgi:hypothetical protein
VLLNQIYYAPNLVNTARDLKLEIIIRSAGLTAACNATSMSGHPAYTGGRRSTNRSSRRFAASTSSNPHSFDSLGVVDAHGRTLTRDQFKEGRKKKGECPSCGQPLFEVRMGGLVKKPLTVAGKVKLGRCLICAGSIKDKKKHIALSSSTPTSPSSPNSHSPVPIRPWSHQSLPTPSSHIVSSPTMSYQRGLTPHLQQQPVAPHSAGNSPYAAQQQRHHQQQQHLYQHQPQGIAQYQQHRSDSYDNDYDYDDDTVYYEPSGSISQPYSFPQTGTGTGTAGQQQQQQQQFQIQPRPLSEGPMDTNTNAHQDWSQSPSNNSNVMQGPYPHSHSPQAYTSAQSPSRQGSGGGGCQLPYFPTGTMEGELQGGGGGSSSSDGRRMPMPVVQARPMPVSRDGSRPVAVIARDGSSGTGSSSTGGRPMSVVRDGSGGSISQSSSSHSHSFQVHQHQHQRERGYAGAGAGNSTSVYSNPTLQLQSTHQQLSNSSSMSDRSARSYQSTPSQEEHFMANFAIINENENDLSTTNNHQSLSAMEELRIVMEELTSRVGNSADSNDAGTEEREAEEEKDWHWHTLDRVLNLLQHHGDKDMVQIKGMRICGSILTKCKQQQQHLQLQQQRTLLQDGASTSTTSTSDDSHWPSPLLSGLYNIIPNSENLIAHLLHLTDRSNNPVTVMNAFMILWAISEFSEEARHEVVARSISTAQHSLSSITNALRQHRSHPDVLVYALLFLCGILKQQCDNEHENENEKNHPNNNPNHKNINMVFTSSLKEGRVMMEDLLDLAQDDDASSCCHLKVSEALCRVFWTMSMSSIHTQQQENNEHPYKEILLQDDKQRPIKAMVDIMNRFQSDEVIQTLVCRTLSNLVAQEDDAMPGDGPLAELLLMSNDSDSLSLMDALVTSVTTALKSHRQGSEGVTQSAMYVLAMAGPLASLPVLRETTESITEIMALFLQESSDVNLNLLSDLTFLFYGRAVQAASKGFVSFAASTQVDDAERDGAVRDVQFDTNIKREQLMNAFGILTTISDQVDVSPLLPKEALGGIIEALDFFGSKSNDVEFCRTTFCFLSSIICCDEETLCCGAALVKVGAVRGLLSCIHRHGLDFEDVVEQGVELLGALIWADPSNAMSRVTASDVSSLLKLWQTHKSNESLQKCALVLLRDLCSPESKTDIIMDNNTTHQNNKHNVAAIVKYIFDVLEEYPQDVTIQEEALTALWSLLTMVDDDDNTNAKSISISIPAVKAAGGIPKIIHAMDQHEYNTEVQEAALACLSVLANVTACAMEIFRTGGAVKAISACKLHDIDGIGIPIDIGVDADAGADSTSLLRNKKNAEGVHEKAMFLLCKLSKNDYSLSLNKNLITNGAVPLAARCLRLFPKSVKLVKAAIQLLAMLSQEEAAISNSTSTKDKDHHLNVFAKEGVHEALIELMSAEDLDPAVNANATKLFLMITSSRSPELAKVDVIQIVITAMHNHKDLVEAQERGVIALGELSVKDAEAKDTIALLGGVEAIVDAMNQFLSSVKCCEKGCVALWSLGFKESVRGAILQANGVTAIVHAMLAHMAQEPVVQSACGALITLTSQSGCRNAFRSADGTSTMLSAMKVHFNSPRLLDQCCNVLSNLAVYTDEDTVEYVTVEQLKTVARCMKLHPSLKTLQKSALRTLWNLSLISFNLPLMKEASEVLQEVLFAAASNFPDDCGERVERLLNLLIF